MRPMIFVPFILVACATTANAGEILGRWTRDDGQATVIIAHCGTELCATNTAIRDPSTGEKVGDVLAMSLEPKETSILVGQAFDRQRDLTYKMEIQFTSALHIVTRGCVLAGLICKDVGWTRAN